MNVTKKNKLLRVLWSLIPWLIICILAAAVILFSITIENRQSELDLRKTQAEKTEQQAINVVAQIVKPDLLVDTIELPAVVTPWEELTVKAEVNGSVIAVPVEEGEKVEKGQTVLRIDPRDYLNAVHSLEARQQLAATNFTRIQALALQNAVSQVQFDEASTTLNELNAALKTARLNLGRCTIQAPFSGIVNKVHAKRGALLDHGDPAFRLLDIDRLKVEVAIPEAEVNAVRSIDQCRIVFAALNNKEFRGRKIFLSSEAEQPAMVYILRLALTNPDHEILPGMFARARIIKKTVPMALAIPLYAVITQNNDKYVFVSENNIAKKKNITTGFFEGWKVLVLSGLSAGDRVIVVGHRGLEDGQPLNVVQTVENPAELTFTPN